MIPRKELEGKLRTALRMLLKIANNLVHDLMVQVELHINIVNAFAKCWDVLGWYSKSVVSISGRADSDIALDMVHKLDEEHNFDLRSTDSYEDDEQNTLLIIQE